LQVPDEARWLRFAGQRLGALFPYRPKDPGCNKRLRAALPLVKRVIRLLEEACDVAAEHRGVLLITDKGFAGRERGWPQTSTPCQPSPGRAESVAVLTRGQRRGPAPAAE
jgi:hypothetical protein